MKKKLLIFFIIVIVIAAAFFAYIAMNLNSLIAQFKPELEKIASETLGVPVQLGKLEASVFPDTVINISDVKLGKSEQDSFKLSDLKLHVKLMPILSGKLDITKLSIKSPTIKAVRNVDGVKIA